MTKRGCVEIQFLQQLNNTNIWDDKYMDLSAIQNPAVWNMSWLKNKLVMTYSQSESKIQGSGKFRVELYEK